jgi:hypothetical protein
MFTWGQSMPPLNVFYLGQIQGTVESEAHVPLPATLVQLPQMRGERCII